jgi:hypothetical protein
MDLPGSPKRLAWVAGGLWTYPRSWNRYRASELRSFGATDAIAPANRARDGRAVLRGSFSLNRLQISDAAQQCRVSDDFEEGPGFLSGIEQNRAFLSI